MSNVSDDDGDINDITAVIVDSAIKVHSALGPGLLEHAYHACLAFELRTRHLDVRAHVGLRSRTST